jgi:hypothetical protein
LLGRVEVGAGGLGEFHGGEHVSTTLVELAATLTCVHDATRPSPPQELGIPAIANL